MAENFSYNFQDSMDKLWFHQNILFWEPSGINFQSLVRITKAAAASPTLLSTKSSSIENGRVHKEKMPMELNITVDQPLFQLQALRRSTTHEPHTSTACFDAGSPSKHRTKISKKAKNLKSLSELQNYELKGFADLGFVFRKEILSPQLINILPGLQRLREKCGESGDSEETREVDEEHVKRPYLSEAWSTRRADSPPLDPQILFKPQQAEMQNHLRFWARNVASMIRHDLDAY